MPANTTKNAAAPAGAPENDILADALAAIRHAAGLNCASVSLPSAQARAVAAALEHCAAHHTGITVAEAGRMASRPHAHASEADRREARRKSMAKWRAKEKK